MHPLPVDQHGWTLIETLVVAVIIGILAAIAIPRYLDQRAQANNAIAVSDLRSLIVVETSREAGGGLTDDPDEVADEGWQGSSDRIRVCAELLDGDDDIVLTAWHLDGTLQYSWRRTDAVIQSNDVELEETCAAQLAGTPETLWPHP